MRAEGLLKSRAGEAGLQLGGRAEGKGPSVWQRGRAEGRGLGIESRGLVGVKGKVRGRWCRWQGWRKGCRNRARRQKGAGRQQGERLEQRGQG